MNNTNNKTDQMPDVTNTRMPKRKAGPERAPTLALRQSLRVANQEEVEELSSNQFHDSHLEDESFYDDLGEPTLTSTTATTPPSNANEPLFAWIRAFETQFAGYRVPQEARAIELALESTPGPTGLISDNATFTTYHDNLYEQDSEYATIEGRYQGWIEEHRPTGLAFWEGRTLYVVAPVDNVHLNHLQSGPYERRVLEASSHIVVRIHLRDTDKSDTFATFDALGIKITSSSKPRAQSRNIWIDARTTDGQTIATALDPGTVEGILTNGNTFAMTFNQLLRLMFKTKTKQAGNADGDIDAATIPPSTRYLTTAEAAEEHPNVRASRGMLLLANSKVPSSRKAKKDPCHSVLPLDYLPIIDGYLPAIIQVSCDRCTKLLATFQNVTEQPIVLRRTSGEPGDTYRVAIFKMNATNDCISNTRQIKSVWATVEDSEFFMRANDIIGEHTHECRSPQETTAPRAIDANDSFYVMAGNTNPESITTRLNSSHINENQSNFKSEGPATSSYSIPLWTCDRNQLTSHPMNDSTHIPSWLQPEHQSGEGEPDYSEKYKSYLRSMYFKEPDSTCRTQPGEQRPRAYSSLEAELHEILNRFLRKHAEIATKQFMDDA